MNIFSFIPAFLSGDLLLPLIIIAPLAGIALILLFQRWPNLREAATLITAGATLFLVVLLLNENLDGMEHSFALPDILPGIALAWKVEPLGLLFAMIASGLLDHQFALFLRLYARQSGRAPDTVLCPLCDRHCCDFGHCRSRPICSLYLSFTKF